MSQTKVTDALRNVTAVDGTKIDAVDGAKITTGTIPEARITSLDATKLTGNIANARIPASAVTQHVTGFDDSSIRADILKLALSQAVDGNRVAYSLEDSFVDGFEDDSGITTETTVDRSTTGEHISSSITTEGTPTQLTLTSGMLSVNSELSGTVANLINGSLSNYAVYGLENTLATANGILTVDYGSAVTWEYFRWYNFRTNGRMKGHKIQTSTDNATWTDQTTTLSETTTSSSSILHDAISANGWNRNTLDTPTSARYIRIVYSSGYNEGDTGCGVAEIQAYQQVFNTVHNATGTLISDPQTASTSRTSASGVIIYEDGAGTNTLGTDLKIYFTANNGTNWTEAASYGTATTYSGTKKLVKLGSTTVTSGTAIAIKAVWANQAVGGDTDHSTTTGWAQSGTIANLFDNDNSTSLGSGGGSTQWFTTDLGLAKVITKYTMTSWTGSSSGSPNAWNIKGSNDTTNGSNGTWSSALDTKSGQSTWGSNEKRTYTFSNSTAYRYWKIEMTASGGGNAPELAEMEYITTAVGKEARLHGWAVNY
jgi:hypothetical protein